MSYFTAMCAAGHGQLECGRKSWQFAYWLQKNSAQQQTLGDICMTTWISMCTEVEVKYWCQMPSVPVWREYR